jgi:hypothetical protein
MQPGLSFEQAPPISVPFRFFLTAPLFGMAAGLLLLWQGPAALASRWTVRRAGADPSARRRLHAAGDVRRAAADAAGGGGRQHLAAAPRHPADPCRPDHRHAAAAGRLLSEQALFFRIAVPFMTVSLGAFALIVLVALFRTPARGRPSSRCALPCSA